MYERVLATSRSIFFSEVSFDIGYSAFELVDLFLKVYIFFKFHLYKNLNQKLSCTYFYDLKTSNISR